MSRIETPLTRLQKRLAGIDRDGLRLPVAHLLYETSGDHRMAFVMPETDATCPVGPIHAALMTADGELVGSARLPVLAGPPCEAPADTITRRRAARRLSVSVATLKRAGVSPRVAVGDLPGFKAPAPGLRLWLKMTRRVSRRGTDRVKGGKVLPHLELLEDTGALIAAFSTAAPGPTAPADGVFALLHREDGTPFVDAKGRWLVTTMDTDRIYQLAVRPSDNALITKKEAAERMGVSLATLKRMTRDGRLAKPVKVADSAVRFRAVDLQTVDGGPRGTRSAAV